MSLGNITNDMRRAHREAVVPVGFLAIPKGLNFGSVHISLCDL